MAACSKKKVLFVCIHNSARSQMAEAFLNDMASKHFEAQSAGLEPGQLNPIVIEVMKEIGLDISKNKTKSVHKFINDGTHFDYVITVCDETSAEACPVFPGNTTRVHMGFADPTSFKGEDEAKFQMTRQVRDDIHSRIKKWIGEVGHD